MDHIVVIGEVDATGAASSTTIENTSLAASLVNNVDVVIGINSFDASLNKADIASELGKYGAGSVEFIDAGSQLVGTITGSKIASGIEMPTLIIGSQSYIGRDVAATLSAKLNVSVLANTSSITIDDNSVVTSHMVFGGTKIAKAKLSSSNPIVLMKPKSFVPVEKPAAGELKESNGESVIDASQITTVTSQEKADTSGVALEDAKVVVSGGRGLGDADNYEKLVGGLAELLDGATGASRAIVDAGWVPYSKQVGQTGKTVKPDVYFACGISGATQHQVGMKGSKKIISINTDADAPVFAISDIAIVGDVNSVLPKLIDAIKSKKG